MVLQKGLIDDALRHRHVYIHGSLHSGLFLQPYKLVLMDALLGPTFGVFLIGLFGCPPVLTILFKEWHCEVDAGLGAPGDDLGPLVAVVVCFGLVRGEGGSELAVLGMFPVDPLEDSMFADLVECSTETWILHEDGLEEAAH